MTQTNEPEHNPWPASAESVIFILDAANGLERKLLEEWLAQHRPAAGSVKSRIFPHLHLIFMLA